MAGKNKHNPKSLEIRQRVYDNGDGKMHLSLKGNDAYRRPGSNKK